MDSMIISYIINMSVVRQSVSSCGEETFATKDR